VQSLQQYRCARQLWLIFSPDASMSFIELFSVQNRVRAGELKLIAVTGGSRTEFAPNVPTVAESGLPGFEFGGWAGLLAPAGVPRDILDRVNREVVDIVNTPDVRRQLAEGAEPTSGTPEDFQRLIESDLKLWQGVAKKSNISID
jgi:tripartite-type tricarboxylate transporter receptor subunit TctC